MFLKERLHLTFLEEGEITYQEKKFTFTNSIGSEAMQTLESVSFEQIKSVQICMKMTLLTQ